MFLFQYPLISTMALSSEGIKSGWHNIHGILRYGIGTVWRRNYCFLVSYKSKGILVIHPLHSFIQVSWAGNASRPVAVLVTISHCKGTPRKQVARVGFILLTVAEVSQWGGDGGVEHPALQPGNSGRKFSCSLAFSLFLLPVCLDP